jgi:hypothetical protein
LGIEDLLSPAREIDDLLTSHLIEDELAAFCSVFFLPEAVFIRMKPKPASRPDEDTSPFSEEVELPPPTEKRTVVVTKEALRVRCQYCGTLTDPIQNSKCPSCEGRPI